MNPPLSTFTQRFPRFCGIVALIFALLAAAFNAIAGLFYTADIEVDPLVSNVHVVLHADTVWLNLLVLLLAVAALLLLTRVPITKKAARAFSLAVVLFVGVAGALWVSAAHCEPYADGRHTVEAAKAFINGGWYYEEYFKNYPFQLGWTLFEELFFRIFGTHSQGLLPYLNVAFLLLSYIAILRMCRIITSDPRVEFITGFLLALFLQPIFFCSWYYGNLPGFAFAMWGTLLIASYLHRGGAGKLVWAVLLLVIASVLKKNYCIFIIANAIVLLLYGLKDRKWLPIVATAALAALTVLAPIAVQKSYEARLNTAFGPGIPMTAWLAMGGHEDYRGPGWFDGTTALLETNGFDMEKTQAQLNADLNDQLDALLTDPVGRGIFYIRKTISQWNEPDFQSLWSSAVSDRSVPLHPLIRSMVYGTGNLKLKAYFNQYIQIIYVCFALGLWQMARKKPITPAALILPISFLGAFVYHVLFEAQSQYVLIYPAVMLPYCAYGLTLLGDRLPHKGLCVAPENGSDEPRKAIR